MSRTIIYHANCTDGFCAAWLLHGAFPSAEFVPANYGDVPPAVNGKEVVIADFSYPAAVLKAMASVAESVIVFDHHKTAAGLVDIHDYDGTGKLLIEFDQSKSGARLVWEFLCANHMLADELHTHYADEPHWLVGYTEDRDLWRWALPNSQAINAAIRSYPFAFDVWNELSKLAPQNQLVVEGEAIARYRQQLVDQHVRHARMTWFSGYEVPFVQCTISELYSDIAGQLAEDHAFAVCYVDAADQGFRLLSLRSRNDGIDVSEIAKQFGGGGHRNASGCKLIL